MSRHNAYDREKEEARKGAKLGLSAVDAPVRCGFHEELGVISDAAWSSIDLAKDSNHPYRIGVDLNLIIHWKNPAKNSVETIEREGKQRDLNYRAQLLAREIVMKLDEKVCEK